MFEKMKRRIGLWMAESKEKKAVRRTIYSTGFWPDIQRVLISLPDGFENWAELTTLTEVIRRHQPKAETIFWTPVALSSMVKHQWPSAGLVTSGDLTYTRWFVPEATSARTRFGTSIDLVIDLSMDFRLDAAYLWSMFNRAYRIGFVTWRNDWFYDMVIRCSPGSAPQQRLKELIKLLESLK